MRIQKILEKFDLDHLQKLTNDPVSGMTGGGMNEHGHGEKGS